LQQINSSHYQWMLDFLEKDDYSKIFFWLEQEGEVSHLTVKYSPPDNIFGMGSDLAEF